MMKRMQGTGLAALLVGVMMAGAAGAETTLKAITSLPPSIPQAQSFLIYFVDAIKKDKNAPVKIDFLGGPEVQPPNKAHNALQRGIVDLLHGPAGYYTGQIPEAYALMATRHPVPKLWESGAFDLLQPLWKKKLNARIVAWGEATLPMHVWTTFKPKQTPKGVDLSGKKLRTSPTYKAFLSALGATPILMPAGDIYTALQRGVIEGFAWPETGLPQLGVAEMVKYRIDPGFYRANSIVIINDDVWTKLSKAEKDYLTKLAHEYEAASAEMMTREQEKEEKLLLDKGMKILTLEGAAANSYLKMAYNAMWERLEGLVKSDTSKLREKFYTEIK